MPRSSTVELHYAKLGRSPVPLKFAVRPHTGIQAAVRGRVVLEPELDLNQYEFRAVIDWIDVAVSFSRLTQFRYVQEELRSSFPRVCFVKAINPLPGGSAEKFMFRVQEPSSAASVLAGCRALARKFGEASAPHVDAIEVSVDAKPIAHDDQARGRLLAVMQRTIFTSRDIIGPERSRPRYHVSGKPVFLFPKSRSENKTLDIWLHSTSDRPAPLDSTLSLGAVHDPVMVKLMDKVIDRQNRTAGTYDQLGDNDKRVRIEVTLNNQELLALGIKEVADLRRYTYVSLQGRCFQFKLPTFIELKCMGAASSTAVKRELEERRLKRFLSTGVVGLLFRQHSERVNRSIHLPELKRQFRMDGRKMTRNRRGGGANGTFVAYERLNRVVSDALWGLAKRERTAWKEQETR